MSTNSEVHSALLNYLNNPHTHASLYEAASELPERFINLRPPNVSYSFWEQLEHIRICQWDMLDFMVNPNYKEMAWPKDYWPDPNQKATKKMWDESIKKFIEDYQALKKLAENTETDLFNKIPHGSGQTAFREILQIIDHNSYHIGQFVLMRKIIGEWNP